MAKILGSKGVITFGTLAGITSFTIDQKSDPVETTVLGAVTKTFMAGVRSFTLECEAISAAPALAANYTAANDLKSFEINGQAEAIDISSIGDVDDASVPFKAFIGGLPEWDAKLEIDMESGTPPPDAGDEYTFAGAVGVVESCSLKDEVNGVVTYSLSIKGSGTLPVALTTAPGSSVAFEVEADTDYIASGDAIVTAFKISGAIGELVKYSLSAQGTGVLVTTEPVGP